MIDKTMIVVLALLLLCVGSGTGGWEARNWYDAKQQAVQVQATQKAIDAFHDHEKAVASILETKLAGLHANQTIVERQVEKLVDRPVYSNTCLDLDGVRLIETARVGSAAASSASAALP